MATVNERRVAIARPESPEAPPTLAIGPRTGLSRCVSTASSMSHGSGTDVGSRHSLGSDLYSRQSSASFQSSRHVSNLSRISISSVDSKGRRRGYMRPQTTDFAASAKSRESVMCLGSIAHLQYYFARTGLLDGKGGQFARKRPTQKATLDMSLLDGSSTTADVSGQGMKATYMSSLDSSADPDSHDDGTNTGFGNLVESPIQEEMDEDEFEDSFPESDPDMLPPTVSTYHQKEKPIPKPPKIEELKKELELCLNDTRKALDEVQARKAGSFKEPSDLPQLPNMPEESTQSWYELQGMDILDVVTLAIRAAKMYYTAHELPDRLDSIKSEKQIRADLLAVMEVLKQMATRNFNGGMKDEEIKIMTDWVASVFDFLEQEHKIELAERAERESWGWLRGDWSGREYERERAFLSSMEPEAELLPEWTPLSEASECPTPFLQGLQNGVLLVKLHNAAVKKSRRRFGAIPTFHTDTQKPYRSADNIRYWAKAAELRFEVMLKVDALGVVYDNGPEVWQEFESAILKWCEHVRQEITSELVDVDVDE
ncbi:uncharacterized protein CPUR_05247 [Claviceps purpurea 20.1]|uniref:Calponin-homology (CH) domain-containing protein n=1 Tax=Claviceps purpurea (strain 20.1) TaxID=1111077 RepID=M1WG10_CLAP2|nr:uncharacterized protein CPUR_05247 [Claviceps purpurea 20.1]